MELSLIQKIVVWALPVIFAITLHEVAHGWAAKYLGDRTAEMMGRLTLNPVRHIDPIGTIAMPLLLLLVSPFVFGWAKPVPVTWENLRNPKRDMALVAIAGPAANLAMVLFWVLVIKLAGLFEGALPSSGVEFLYLMGAAGIIINIVLMVLNMIPIPPLDGSRVVSSMLPGAWANSYSRLEPYGLIILLVLLVTGVLGKVLTPAVMSVQQMVYRLLT
ncbi:Zn-dependent protease [Methylohalomonas lacus]|uniref:Zn-dependent protease n=1 Tax=Methylohalomonas lacus TaxID=398773 RepID=A0AAE3HL33_9GAMM|nr:site-2 protease family protein [Methylohalomonas lacus]MCS3903104.1 Zn-dependent protease [Methylohalomonas lacus]